MPGMTLNGKICYVELPAADVARSSTFYENVLGWKMRKRGDGALAFDDSVGAVSGSFASARFPWSGTPGLLMYIMSTVWLIRSTPSSQMGERSRKRSARTHRRSPPDSAILPATSSASIRNGPNGNRRRYGMLPTMMAVRTSLDIGFHRGRATRSYRYATHADYCTRLSTRSPA